MYLTMIVWLLFQDVYHSEHIILYSDGCSIVGEEIEIFFIRKIKP